MKYQVINHQHIFESETAFMQCHASTICRLPDGTLGTAWFGGAHEKAPDVAIWFSRREDGEWSVPVKIADREGIPCWNPVLYVADGRLLLFYKVGNEISRWQTMVKESEDSGKNWSEERELVPGDFGGRGPVKNKCIQLSDGTVLAPASTEEGSWECFADLSADGGRSWKRGENVPVDREGFFGSGLIQPTLWQDDAGTVHMLMRSSEGAVFKSDSFDGGITWSKARRTALPNNNCGIDLARLSDGRLVLVYNPVSGNWAARSPIAFTVSDDNGETWGEPRILDHVPCRTNIERAEFSYPAIIAEGNEVFITYTWKRRTIAFWQIRFPAKTKSAGLPEGLWPVMPTPFTQAGEIDYPALEKLTEWYISKGADGLFTCCLSGEMEMLSRKERLEMAAFVKKCAGSRVPVAASGNQEGTLEEQIRSVRDMAETGVDVVVLVINRLVSAEADENELKQALRTVLHAVADIKLGLYECPKPYKRTLSPEMTAWCADTGRFVFLKETSGDPEMLKAKIEAVKGTGLKIYNADSSLMLASQQLGGHGYCGIMLSFHPGIYRWMMDHWKDDRQLAEQTQQLMTVTAQVERQCYPKSAKYALAQAGVPIRLFCRRKDAEEWNSGCVRAVDDMQQYVRDFLTELERKFLTFS